MVTTFYARRGVDVVSAVRAVAVLVRSRVLLAGVRASGVGIMGSPGHFVGVGGYCVPFEHFLGGGCFIGVRGRCGVCALLARIGRWLGWWVCLRRLVLGRCVGPLCEVWSGCSLTLSTLSGCFGALRSQL